MNDWQWMANAVRPLECGKIRLDCLDDFFGKLHRMNPEISGRVNSNGANVAAQPPFGHL